MPPALLALAICAFGIGTTEFVIVGLLPEIAIDLHVSIPSAGLLVSGYALGVVAGAPLLTVGTIRLPRKRILVVLMILFLTGNLLSAVATTYPLLLSGRILASLCHGAFFGVGSVVAADVARPGRRAQAIALMFTGLTLANVLGVPAGAALGQWLGWRSTFWAIVIVGVVGLVALSALVPRQPVDRRSGLREQLAPFRNPQVWLALAVTTFGFGGLFAGFTYIAPMMTEVAGFSAGAVTWLLVLFGVGLCIGNLFGGRYADRALVPTLFTTLTALTAVLLLLGITAHWRTGAALTLLALGVAGFATVPALQLQVVSQAGETTLAAAVNIAAFNLGNAIGAYVGGLTISAGLGYTSPTWVGAAMTAAGLAVAAIALAVDRTSRSTPPLALATATAGPGATYTVDPSTGR